MLCSSAYCQSSSAKLSNATCLTHAAIYLTFALFISLAHAVLHNTLTSRPPPPPTWVTSQYFFITFIKTQFLRTFPSSADLMSAYFLILVLPRRLYVKCYNVSHGSLWYKCLITIWNLCVVVTVQHLMWTTMYMIFLTIIWMNEWLRLNVRFSQWFFHFL